MSMRGRLPLKSLMANRRQAEDAGRRAETLAALWLGLKGYRILARRFRASGGEIDLIAARPFFGAPTLIAFVEVKQRTSEGQFAEAISAPQRRRIEAAAAQFMQRHVTYAGACLRFDGMFVRPGAWPRHEKDLWRAGH